MYLTLYMSVGLCCSISVFSRLSQIPSIFLQAYFVYFFLSLLYKEISFDPKEARGENGNRAFLLPS